jgi:hypothetical protein
VTSLLDVPAVTIRRVPDARPVGRLYAFSTNDPARTCVNGSTLPVYVAPAEFRNSYVVVAPARRGCPAASWTFPVAPG